MCAASFLIEGSISDERVLAIRDVGPWDRYPTVTNDAEGVVRRLQHELIGPHQSRRLFYYDSEGDLDELVLEDGPNNSRVFKCFAPVLGWPPTDRFIAWWNRNRFSGKHYEVAKAAWDAARAAFNTDA